MRNHWINHIFRLRSEWTLPFVASLLCCCVTGGPRNITVAPLLYSQCNVLVDASSPWRQKLQHFDITRLTYNALWRHGPGPPRYKEGRLYYQFERSIKFVQRFFIQTDKSLLVSDDLAGIHLEHGFASMPRRSVKRRIIFCHACPSPAFFSTVWAIVI